MDGLEPAFSSGIDRKILLRQVYAHLGQCTGENAARDGRIFRLYYQSGLTAAAISRVPGIDLTQKGVETRLFRMSDCLRRVLGTANKETFPGIPGEGRAG